MSIKIPTFKAVQYLANPTTLDTFVRHYAAQMPPDAERLFRETLATVIDEATKPLILYVDGEDKPIDAPEVPPAEELDAIDAGLADVAADRVMSVAEVRGEVRLSDPIMLQHGETGRTMQIQRGSEIPYGWNPIMAANVATPKPSSAPPADENPWRNPKMSLAPANIPVEVLVDEIGLIIRARRVNGTWVACEDLPLGVHLTRLNSWRYIADQPKADAPVETDEKLDAESYRQVSQGLHKIIAAIAAERDELRAQLGLLTRQHAELEAMLAESSKQMEELIGERNRLASQRDELRAQLEMQSKLITENLDEIDKLRTWVTKLQREKQGLESSHFDPIKIERDELRESLESASAQLNQANAEGKRLTIECWTKRDEHKQAALERDTALAQLDVEMRRHNELRDSIRQSTAILIKALMVK